ncbi:MAG: hypothetical protein HQL24_01045 [Candidatus Omnitrophica bacterium]|nr:hypothetical protein [Candidatus Omnitrophota bacterium]
MKKYTSGAADNEFPILIISGVIIACVLFLGAMKGLKSLIKTPPPKVNIDSTLKARQQKQMMDDIEQQRKNMMEAQKQRIRDMRHK